MRVLLRRVNQGSGEMHERGMPAVAVQAAVYGAEGQREERRIADIDRDAFGGERHMSLIEYDLFGEKRDKVDIAIKRLQAFEPKG